MPAEMCWEFFFYHDHAVFFHLFSKKEKKTFCPKDLKHNRKKNKNKLKSLSHIPQFSLLFCLTCFDLMRLLGLVLTSHSEYSQNQSGISV